MVLKDLLSDIISVKNVLLIVKSNGATSEIRSNSLSIKQNEKWITIGDNDGPCHMHVNNELIKRAEYKRQELVLVLDFSMKIIRGFLHVFSQKCTMKIRI